MKRFVFKIKYLATVSVLVLLSGSSFSQSAKPDQSEISFKGQLSSSINAQTEGIFSLGGRYIPQFNYSGGNRFSGENNIRFDAEIAANLFGNGVFGNGMESSWSGDIKLYRGWAKVATNRSELRVGLQKINFGSATILRPLMWFDSMDPRDPLQLTEGVWGGLGRYFSDNSNLWLWVLYGNNKTRAYDIGVTTKERPEFGGRFQKSLKSGEAAISFHHRKSNLLPSAEGFSLLPQLWQVPENRLGVDAKIDVKIGLWFELSWINKGADAGVLTNQHLFNIGTDYTFGIGNGLNLIFEHLLMSFDRQAFKFSNRANISALSANYPLTMSDNLNLIIYYDWENGGVYNFVNWKHNFRDFSLNVMGYANPDNFSIPLTAKGTSLYSGNGLQIMLIYTHRHSTKKSNTKRLNSITHEQ
jgi:hypothetical protein